MENLKRRDRHESSNLDNVRIEKEVLAGATYPQLPTGKARLLRILNLGAEEEVTVINPLLTESSDRSSTPLIVRSEVFEKYCKTNETRPIPNEIISMLPLNNGCQLLFTISGPAIFEEYTETVSNTVKVKGKNVLDEKEVRKARKVGEKPYLTFNIGKVEFNCWLLFLHRYDRVKQEIHLEIEVKKGPIFYLKKSDNVELIPWMKKTFADLQSIDPDKTAAIKRHFYNKVAGAIRRDAISPRSAATLEKFDAITTSIQKGITMTGENSLGILLGLAFYSENFNDGTMENDFLQGTRDTPTNRGKFDDLLESLLTEANL